MNTNPNENNDTPSPPRSARIKLKNTETETYRNIMQSDTGSNIVEEYYNIIPDS